MNRSIKSKQIYRNRVNRERKLCKSKYYQAKVNDHNGIDSRKWWSECRRLCGMQKFSGDLAAKLLYGMPPTKINIISLANDINNGFLEPQQVFEPLQASYRLVQSARNKVNSMMRKAKSDYFRLKIDASKATDPKAGWNLQAKVKNLPLSMIFLLTIKLFLTIKIFPSHLMISL